MSGPTWNPMSRTRLEDDWSSSATGRGFTKVPCGSLPECRNSHGLQPNSFDVDQSMIWTVGLFHVWGTV